MTSQKPKLTAKQERFCREYLVDGNATQAAKRAGYSQRTADAIGKENLRKPPLKQRIAELTAAQQERTEITADAVLREFGRYAFPDAANAHECAPNERLKALDSLGRHFGVFNDKLVHQFDFSALSEDELDAIILEGA